MPYHLAIPHQCDSSFIFSYVSDNCQHFAFMIIKEKNLEEERFSKFILEREKIKGDSQNKGIRGKSYLNIGSQ